MDKNIWLILSLCTTMITACSQKQMQEMASNTMVTQNRTPDKTWRVKPGSVHDGDTFRAVADVTNEEIKVRLACIDAPELEQAGGVEARDYLRSMLTDNREIILMGAGKDQYGRSVVEVFAITDTPGLEVGVNGEMVLAGMAHYYERYKRSCPENAEQYEFLEQEAISSKAGVWANGDAERPWNWRGRNK
ncbi:thermonuclease family protein [Synechocystis sp. PCC 6803]|nr:thermonuclease family protein [Synechocystis sp. PCC 6803]